MGLDIKIEYFPTCQGQAPAQVVCPFPVNFKQTSA